MSLPTRRTPPIPGIVGIDPSLSGTGLYFTHGMVSDKIETPAAIMKAGGVNRLAWLRDEFSRKLRVNRGCIAVIEGYAMGARNQREALGEWGGILRLCLFDAGFTKIYTVAPQTLKKFVIGHAKEGQSGKDVMLLQTYKRWSTEFSDHDKCDAFCLAKAGEVLEGRAGTKTDQETLAKAKMEKL